jgi:hypothetical protein
MPLSGFLCGLFFDAEGIKFISHNMVSHLFIVTRTSNHMWVTLLVIQRIYTLQFFNSINWRRFDITDPWGIVWNHDFTGYAHYDFCQAKINWNTKWRRDNTDIYCYNILVLGSIFQHNTYTNVVNHTLYPAIASFSWMPEPPSSLTISLLYGTSGITCQV